MRYTEDKGFSSERLLEQSYQITKSLQDDRVGEIKKFVEAFLPEAKDMKITHKTKVLVGWNYKQAFGCLPFVGYSDLMDPSGMVVFTPPEEPNFNYPLPKETSWRFLSTINPLLSPAKFSV